MGIKLLVIDDEQIIRDGCTRILSKEGYDVTTAEGGEQGLEIIHKQRPDIVLLDMKMPGISGLEVLGRINQLKIDVTVIVITGYATVETAVDAMKEGAYDFISKPFNPDQLRLVVKRAVEKRRLEQEAKMLLKDITNEKSRMRTIIYCMADGVLVTNMKGELVLYNPAASRMLAIADNSAPGKPIRELIRHKEIVEMIEKHISSINSSLSSIYKEVSVNKNTVLRVHIAPVRGELGELLGFVSVLQDISQLRAMDQMKSDFVAMVCHQLRSPLSTVIQQIGAILTGVVEKEKEKEMLIKVKERIRDLISLINNLLDISKIEAGLAIQHKELLRLDEILKETIEFLKPQAEEKKIEMEVFIESNLPSIDGDRECIKEVFLNLIGNAINYTPQDGKIKVDAIKEGECLKVNVADTGIGIPKEDIPRIFDKFYRVRTDKTQKIRGSGLGLSIVKGIIEAHLGSIHVESKPDKGTTFTLFLPASINPNI